MLSQGDKNDKQDKKPSTLGFLFKPNYSADNRMMRQAWGLFVRMIAMVFVAFRLFDKDHPAFLDDTLPLSLRDVVRHAYSQLSFTKEGLPQVVAFTAVVLMLLFAVLFLVTLAGSLLVGSAHAQSAGAGSVSMFSPVDTQCDIVSGWLDYLFGSASSLNNTNCTLAGSALSSPSGSGMKEALHMMLNFFSKAILVCAGFILIFYLFIVIAESAHTGKPFGRANALWAPIRLVLAIGLLVPVSSETGMNLAQHVVLQTARWGSGLASQTWDLALNKILASKEAGALDANVPVPEEIVNIVNNAVLMKACSLAVDQVIEVLYSGDTTGAQGNYLIGTNGTSLVTMNFCPGVKGTAQCSGYAFESAAPQKASRCGRIVLPSPALSANQNAQTQRMVQAFFAAHEGALQNLMSSGEVNTAARAILPYLGNPYSTVEQSEVEMGLAAASAISARNRAINSYRESLASGFKNAVEDSTSNEDLASFARQGWVVAGAWYNTVARVQSAVFTGAEGGVPKVYPIIGNTEDIRNGVIISANDVGLFDFSERKNLNSVNDTVVKALAVYKEKITDQPFQVNPSSAEAAATGVSSIDIAAGRVERFAGPMAFLFDRIEEIGVNMGLWLPGGAVTPFIGKSANPIAELTSFGYRNVRTGLEILNLVIVGSVFKALPGAGDFLGGLISIAMFIALIFMGAGVTLAFLLPLIPFIKFFYNVLTWFLQLLAAVVSAPLFALAHLSPYGDGPLPGAAVKGYQTLFDLFLRPVLLVFGLVLGFLFFFISISLLNMTMGIAAAGSGAATGALPVLAKFVYTVLYVVWAYVCANKCFQMISFLPDQISNWYGGAKMASRDMGDKAETTNALKVAAGYLGVQGVERLTGPGAAVGKYIGGKAGKMEMAPATEARAIPGKGMGNQAGAISSQQQQGGGGSSYANQMMASLSEQSGQPGGGADEGTGAAPDSSSSQKQQGGGGYAQQLASSVNKLSGKAKGSDDVHKKDEGDSGKGGNDKNNPKTT